MYVMNEKWFLLEISEIEKKLKTNAACGISRKAARSRLRKEGKNDFFHTRQRSVSQCIKRVLADPMLLLIIAVNIIAAVFGSVATAIASGIMILLNISASVFAYIKASRVVESMAEYSQPKVTVIREGKLYYADARAIVKGDVILLSPGDILPCDARIVSCNNFSVLCYEGKRSDEEERILLKNASASYTEGDTVKLYEYENMVCAGSQVVEGSARAIVVETGKYTYIGALDGGITLNNSADSLPALSNLKKISLAYSFIVMAVILPLTVIGIFTFGSAKILDVFMLIMSLSVSALGELIYVIGGIIVSSGLIELATDKKNDNSAIIKTLSVLDRVAEPDYLILLGDSALSDGSFRVDKLLIGDEELEGKGLISPNAFRFAELVMMNEYARTLSPAISAEEKRPLRDAVKLYGIRLGIDDSIFSERVRTASYYPQFGEQTESTAMLLHGERVSVFTSENAALLDRCTFVRTKNGNLPLLQDIKDEIKQYISELQRNGRRILICATSNAQQNGRPTAKGLTLEGVAAFIKNRLPMGSEYIRSLEDSGVKLLTFIDRENGLRIAQVAKMLGKSRKNEVVLCSALGDNAEAVYKKSENCSIFAGFSDSTIKDFVKKLRESGKTVETVGFLTKHVEIAEESDVAVTFGDFDYKTSGIDITKLESTPLGESENSREGAQTMRYTSDVIVKRPTALGGGLGAICNAMRVASGIHINLETVFTYLVCIQAARIIVGGIASVAVGRFLMTSPQIIFGGLMLDFCIAMSCAFDSYNVISPSLRFYSFKSIFSKIKRPLLCVILASVASVAVAIPISFITKADVSRATFVSFTMMQLSAFILMRYERRVKNLFSTIAIATLAGGAAVALLFSLVPPFAAVFGAGHSSFVSLLIVPVAPAVFSLTYFLFCMKKRKK